jgi:DNA polymerase-3 subunit epsilon
MKPHVTTRERMEGVQTMDDGLAGDAGASELANTATAAVTDAVDVASGLGMDLGPRFQRFVSSLERPIVFFDIEATGTDPVADRIVEISLLRVCPAPGGVEPPRTFRVDPQVRIPVEATEIHGIVNDDLAGAPTFADVAPSIAEILADADLAGFAIGRFDVRILQQEFQRAGHSIDLQQRRVVDTQVIFHQREPRNLAAALEFYRGKRLVDAHGAQADTVASLEVFAGQLERYGDLPVEVDGLHAESSQGSDTYCDTQRRFQWRDHEPAFNFGRLRGTPLRWVAADPEERRYLRWFLEGSFDEDAKAIVRDALGGRIRRRPVPAPRRA